MSDKKVLEALLTIKEYCSKYNECDTCLLLREGLCPEDNDTPKEWAITADYVKILK